MSLSANRWGGQCPSPPPTFRDWVKLWSVVIGASTVFAWLVLGYMPIRLTPTDTHASILPLKRGERR